MKDRKIFKTTSGVAAPRILEVMAKWKRFGNCCCKTVTCHFEWYRMRLNQQGYCTKDWHWKSRKKVSLLMLCTTCIDCRTGAGLRCYLSRFYWDGWQWSWLFKRNCNWWRILALCLWPSNKTTICVGWRKFTAATETLIPEVSSEEHVGDMWLAGSHAQRICTRRADC